MLTPDSSRFWPAAQWEPGRAQASYDKQFVRDWLTSPASGWDRSSGEAPPPLPEDVVARDPGALRRGLRAAHRAGVRMSDLPVETPDKRLVFVYNADGGPAQHASGTSGCGWPGLPTTSARCAA